MQAGMHMFLQELQLLTTKNQGENMNIALLRSRALGQSELFLKKHGPEILVGAGIAGFGITAYLAGKAALKSQEPVKELRLRLEEVKTSPLTKEYTEKERTTDYGRVLIIGSIKIAGIYLPAIATGVISAACVLTAHGMMQKRQASLVAAYTALDQGFRAYRRRVSEVLGEEKEQELYRRPVRKIESIDETGTPCEIDDPDDRPPSPYAVVFDQTNKNWRNRNDYNLLFLKHVEMWADDRLNSRGILFLNEVYDELGMEWTTAGQNVGWKLDGKWKATKGDGFVSFGLPAEDDPRWRVFRDGFADDIIIDPNVDGPIVIG
jgi:Family of unknown function (DUF6353)